MADIFLSYAREDEARARTLARKLESRGWSVWWDRRILPGRDFISHIQEQLDSAACIVVLWSKISVKSPFVIDEADEGRLKNRLVPLFIEAVRPPLGFRGLQAADLSDWAGDGSHEGFDRLLESITAIIPPRAEPEALPPPVADSHDRGKPFSTPAPSSLASDIYVSYSHTDNVPLVEDRKGWVANFARALEIRLAQLLGRQSRVWFDPKITGDDQVVTHDSDQPIGAAVFVAVVSPHYVNSASLLRELEAFASKAREAPQPLQVPGKSPIFKVMKTPVPLERQPVPLQSLIGYEFFRWDPDTGRVREWDEIFGPDSQREFWLKLDDLAHDISDLLSVVASPVKHA